MKRLPCPEYAPEYAYATCVSAIIDEPERSRMIAGIDDIRDAAIDFVARASAGATWELPPLVVPRGENPIVVGDIRKSELVALYEYYMVQRPQGRVIYDSILVRAGDECPTCGGIGHPRTLDHYLPKANYPKLAVLPHNLIPACRDCNTDKRNPLIDQPHEQLIHPYFDQPCFFEQTWISASVTHDQPHVITYAATPPDTWLELDRQRAVNHFDFFGIAKRYSIAASGELIFLMDMRRSYFQNRPAEEFSQYLRSATENSSLFPNHWRRVMYTALAEDPVFCAL